MTSKEVKTGYECGLVFDGFNDIQEFDIVGSLQDGRGSEIIIYLVILN